MVLTTPMRAVIMMYGSGEGTTPVITSMNLVASPSGASRMPCFVRKGGVTVSRRLDDTVTEAARRLMTPRFMAWFSDMAFSYAKFVAVRLKMMHSMPSIGVATAENPPYFCARYCD